MRGAVGKSLVVRAFGLSWQAGAATLLLLLAVAAGALVVPIAAAWLMKAVLDAVASPGRPVAGAVLVAFAATGVLALLLPQVTQYLQTQLDRSTAAFASDRLFAAVLRLPGLAPFEDPAFLDRLRLARQVAGGAPSRVVGAAVGTVRGMLTVVGFSASLLLLSPVMTVVVLASAVPALWAQLRLAGRQAAATQRLSHTVRREFFYGDLLVDVQAAKEIRLFGTGGFLRSRVRALRAYSDHEHRRMDRADLGVQGVLTAAAAVISGIGFVWAAGAAIDGRLSVGDLSMFVATVAGVQAAVAAVVRDIGVARQDLLMLRHYVEIVEDGAAQRVVPALLAPLRRGIELRDVWFRYSEGHPWILRGVDLFIPAGAAVALVGCNGAGKSTLVKLLLRLYEPERGQILWDGVDVRDVAVDDLRHRMSVVFQDFMRYELTARENVAMGDIGALADLDRLTAAAVAAGAHEMVAALPRGYETMLTRGFFHPDEEDDPQIGVTLSGGQWQRLALARSMLRTGRDLTVLDEPSAGLDPDAEHELHVSLREQLRGRTSLLISHRLGALRHADVIAVLDGGRIVEQGGHEQLLAAGGAYARLFLLQAEPYRDEPADREQVPA